MKIDRRSFLATLVFLPPVLYFQKWGVIIDSDIVKLLWDKHPASSKALFRLRSLKVFDSTHLVSIYSELEEAYNNEGSAGVLRLRDFKMLEDFNNSKLFTISGWAVTEYECALAHIQSRKFIFNLF